MWTVFLAKIEPKKYEGSDPSEDPNKNFVNLINDLKEKLDSIKSGRGGWFEIDKSGQLNIVDENTTITFTPTGFIQVDIPAA